MTEKTQRKWLKTHPEIQGVSRDRASAYSQAATAGAPQAMQVADRFHLLQTEPKPTLREGPPSPRMVRWWLLGHLSKNDSSRKAEQETFVQRLCCAAAEIHAAQTMSLDFVQMVKPRRSDTLPGGLKEAQVQSPTPC